MIASGRSPFAGNRTAESTSSARRRRELFLRKVKLENQISKVANGVLQRDNYLHANTAVGLGSEKLVENRIAVASGDVLRAYGIDVNADGSVNSVGDTDFDTGVDTGFGSGASGTEAHLSVNATGRQLLQLRDAVQWHHRKAMVAGALKYSNSNKYSKEPETQVEMPRLELDPSSHCIPTYHVSICMDFGTWMHFCTNFRT
jgi:hypothetical protein